MAQKTQHVGCRQRLHLTLVLLLLTSNLSWSQVDRFIRTYNFKDSQLLGYNYSVQGAYQDCGLLLCYRGENSPDEYIAAGTYGALGIDSQFHSAGIHFMHLNPDGGIRQCNPITGGGYGPASFRFRPDTSFADQHSVATFTWTNQNKAFVVSQLRQSGTNPRASVNILAVDVCSGGVTWNKTLSNPNRNLYVMDASFIESDEVFMTGYSTDTLGSDKKTMFIKYEVGTGLFKAIEINTTTAASLPYDFDMGLTTRRILSPFTRYPMIVGSCNSDSGSASLALIINRTNMQVANIFYLRDTTGTTGEYAFDFDELSDGYVIYSNKYKQVPDTVGPLFFNPKALYPMVTYLDRNDTTEKFKLSNNGTKQRYNLRSSSTMPDTSWAWGTHIDVDDGIMSGVVAYRDPNASSCNLNGNTTPAIDQAVPFMAKLSLGFSKTTGTFSFSSISWWKQYHSNMSRYSYPKMGSQNNNMHWPNNFSFHNRFAGPVTTSDIMLLASNYEFNKLKAVRTTSSGDINPSTGAYATACSSSVVSCVPGKVNVSVSGAVPNWTRDTLILTVSNAVLSMVSDTIIDTKYCVTPSNPKWTPDAPSSADDSLWGAGTPGRIDWVNTDRFNLYLTNDTVAKGYIQAVANDFYDSTLGTYKIVINVYSSITNTVRTLTVNNARHPDIQLYDDRPDSLAIVDTPNYHLVYVYENLGTSPTEIYIRSYEINNPFDNAKFSLTQNSSTPYPVGSSGNAKSNPHIDAMINESPSVYPFPQIYGASVTWQESDGSVKVKNANITDNVTTRPLFTIGYGVSPDVAQTVGNTYHYGYHTYYDPTNYKLICKKHNPLINTYPLIDSFILDSGIVVTGQPRIEAFNRLIDDTTDIEWIVVAEVFTGSKYEIREYRAINGVVHKTNFSTIPVYNTSGSTLSVGNNPLFLNNGYSPCVAAGNGPDTYVNPQNLGNKSYTLGWWIEDNQYNALTVAHNSTIAAESGYATINTTAVSENVVGSGQSKLALSNGSNDGAGLASAWVANGVAGPIVRRKASNTFSFKPAHIAPATRSTGWQLYPNPATDYITLSGNGAAVYHLTDITGRKLMQGSVFGEGSVNVSQLPVGMYLIQIQSGSKKETFKFLKQ